MITPELGKKYKHPSLGLCTVFAFAKHSETDQPMVLFQDKYGEFFTTRESLWLKKVKATKEKTVDPKTKVRVDYPKPNVKYNHYKGGFYVVNHLAKDTETGDPMVFYTSLLYGSNHLRPLSMWFETIKKVDNRVNVQRFEEVK